MATINKADIGDQHVLGSSKPGMAAAAAPIAGYPLAPPANHEVTTAAKIPLAPGTRAVIVSCVAGAIYAISGVEADDNIAVGGGFYCPAGADKPIPVRPDDTHLLVVPAA